MQPASEHNTIWGIHTTGPKTNYSGLQRNARVSQYLTSSLALTLLRLVSVLVPRRECFPCSKWRGLRVLDGSWPPSEKPAIYMLISTTAHSKICRWNISDSCRREGGSGEAFVLYVHFCMHYRKWFFLQDDPQKNPAINECRALRNPPEWLEFLAQSAHVTKLSLWQTSGGEDFCTSLSGALTLNSWRTCGQSQQTLAQMLVTVQFVQIVTHLPFFSPFKCVIPCTTIVALWLVTINVQLRISALSLSLFLSLCLSFCFAADCLCVCFLCFLHVSVCVVRLWSFLSVSGHRLSRGSPPRLPPLPRRRAAPPMPLCSPPVWLFTASSVSISTAAPPLTKAYSRRTGKGRCRAWVQWVRHNENEEPLQ